MGGYQEIPIQDFRLETALNRLVKYIQAVGFGYTAEAESTGPLTFCPKLKEFGVTNYLDEYKAQATLGMVVVDATPYTGGNPALRPRILVPYSNIFYKTVKVSKEASYCFVVDIYNPQGVEAANVKQLKSKYISTWVLRVYLKDSKGEILRTESFKISKNTDLSVTIASTGGSTQLSIGEYLIEVRTIPVMSSYDWLFDPLE